MRLLGAQRLLACNSRGFRPETGQGVEELGARARLELEGGRHRDQNLLRRLVVERRAPQVTGTHRSCDKYGQPDRRRRQHGQQSVCLIGRRPG
jgi:hypothetical protein